MKILPDNLFVVVCDSFEGWAETVHTSIEEAEATAKERAATGSWGFVGLFDCYTYSPTQGKPLKQWRRGELVSQDAIQWQQLRFSTPELFTALHTAVKASKPTIVNSTLKTETWVRQFGLAWEIAKGLV